MHGKDVSKYRLDDLDKEIIRFAISLENKKKKSIDLGSGSGRISVFLALLGWETLLFDIGDFSEHFEKINQALNLNMIFSRQDIKKIISNTELFAETQIVILQRLLHHFKFDEATHILKEITRAMPSGSKIFVSFSGLNSLLSQNYPDKNMSVENRYSTLSPEMAEKFYIKGKVCLYDAKDVEKLIQQIPKAKINKMWISRFGNVKAVIDVE